MKNVIAVLISFVIGAVVGVILGPELKKILDSKKKGDDSLGFDDEFFYDDEDMDIYCD